MREAVAIRGLVLVLVALSVVPARAEPEPAPPVALVLQVTVDGLRADALGRVLDRLPEGGFRRWLDGGAVYVNARYRHAATFTAAGHATLATGTDPARHGLVANEWYRRADGVPVYCVGDDAAPLLGVDGGAGRSPRNLIGTTFGDELVLASSGRSRAFSVSIKDRGAILPGGHLGKAVWYDRPSGRFVTSGYYYAQEPGWLTAFAEEGRVTRLAGSTWVPLLPAERYRAQGDEPLWERGAAGLGPSFPHRLAGDDATAFRNALPFTPFADELVGELAARLVEAEELGGGGLPDYLAVSFSASDYVQHAFGPDSLEAEDALLRLDRTLARLLAALDARLGAGRVLAVLAADHGFDRSPERYLDLGMESGRLDPAQLVAGASAALREAHGLEADAVRAFAAQALYLDRELLARAGIDEARAQETVASFLRAQPGVAFVATRASLEDAPPGAQGTAAAVLRSFHAARSGDVVFVQAPFWYLYEDVGTYTAMHGSPYAYDTRVPLAFAGPGIAPRLVERDVSPDAVAPTLAAHLGIPPPAASTGNVLVEVVAAGEPPPTVGLRRRPR